MWLLKQFIYLHSFELMYFKLFSFTSISSIACFAVYRLRLLGCCRVEGAVAGCLPGTSGAELARCLRAQEASGAKVILKSLPDGPGTLLDPAESANDDLAVLLEDTRKLKYVNPSATMRKGIEAAIEERLIRDMVTRSSSLPALGKTPLSHGK